MSKLIFDMNVSLDGHTNGAEPSLDQSTGRGGMRLHAWAFGGNGAPRSSLGGPFSPDPLHGDVPGRVHHRSK
jgi:hypothetical protein